LLWLAFFILVAGGIASYMCTFDRFDSIDSERRMLQIALYSIIAAGISVICALGDWFLHR
jgi:hypothetical protein